MKIISVSIAMCLMSGVCLAQDKSTIQLIEDRLARAMLADDGKAAAAVYAEDAVLIPPGEPMVSGRTNIDAYWKDHAAGLAEMKLTSMDVQSLGPDSAREIGTYAGKTKGNNPVSFSGKYVLIFRKIETEWVATTDIWNADR